MNPNDVFMPREGVGSWIFEVSFWQNVKLMPSGCWVWTGSVRPDGYGSMNAFDPKVPHKKRFLAHRISFRLARGRYTVGGLVLDHLCRVRRCVRPSHLEEVSHAVNILRGVGMAARHAVKTHCSNGHELTHENIYHHPKSKSNWRLCRLCHNASQERTRSKRRARAESTNAD
jgi:hypothetical protein